MSLWPQQHDPFVMNTGEELLQAFEDDQAAVAGAPPSSVGR
ncbi:MAG TPA: hypothetical protein VGC06_15890 [Actinomycetes bacterium]